MTEETAEPAIQAKLDQIAREQNVSILHACESGSRAWGFASTDSDYDVRFIYVRPTEWYLTIQNKRDVIEEMVGKELDMVGWDLPKALELFRRSNPPLLEHLQSPIIYRDAGSLFTRLKELIPRYYSPVRCMYHYFRMATSNNRRYHRGPEVWTKKYFYILRPLLACLWIKAGYGIVPTEFRKLVDRTVTEPRLLEAIAKLLVRKSTGKELDWGPRVPVISDFIDDELNRLDAENQPPSDSKDPQPLDALFVKVLAETNGDIAVPLRH